MAMGIATAGRRPGSQGDGLTLREALREHPAGPELVAALGALADRLAPRGWDRWPPAARERYLDAALDEARAGGRSAA
jgi:hypothetical protein